MPRIFGNIDHALLPALRDVLAVSDHAHFCVGYFNLFGGQKLGDAVEGWAGGPGHRVRLLVGMQRLPHDDLRHALRIPRPTTTSTTAPRPAYGSGSPRSSASNW